MSIIKSYVPFFRRLTRKHINIELIKHRINKEIIFQNLHVSVFLSRLILSNTCTFTFRVLKGSECGGGTNARSVLTFFGVNLNMATPVIKLQLHLFFPSLYEIEKYYGRILTENYAILLPESNIFFNLILYVWLYVACVCIYIYIWFFI